MIKLVYISFLATTKVMSNTLTYQYKTPSTIQTTTDGREMLFSSCLPSVDEQQTSNIPCFFWGKLTEPFLTAKCLLTLSNIVAARYYIHPSALVNLKDPIVTAGEEQLRFEGFSSCCGIYGRLDVLPNGLDGEFLAIGTTNVDFNAPMQAALGSIRKSEQVVMSIGTKEVTLQKKGNDKVVEKKVPLPLRWIKGLSAVQFYLSEVEEKCRFSRFQTIKLFARLPKGRNLKADYYLNYKDKTPRLSPVKSKDSICIGGVERLQLLKDISRYANEMSVFTDEQQQITVWQLHFEKLRFTFALSRETWRGFSGEGKGLEALQEEINEDWLAQMRTFCKANQSFNPTLLAIEKGIDANTIEQITAKMAAMGLLGFDLERNSFFYRELPFRLDRIEKLNPRLKGVEKLLADENAIQIIYQSEDLIEADIKGTKVKHRVQIQNGKARCTCPWFSKHQGERGYCKHILATKKYLNL